MVLTFLGLFLSSLWLGLCGWYFERTIGFSQIALLMPNELGQFLSGIFLPLAFLWVLVAYANLAGRVRALERGGIAIQDDVPRSEPSRSEPSVGRTTLGAPGGRGPGDRGGDQKVPTLRVAADQRS